MRRIWVGLLLVVALVPFGAGEAAACSPRTFSSIQPPAPSPTEIAPAPQVEQPPAEEPPADQPPVEEPPVEEPPVEEPPVVEPPVVEPPVVEPPVEEPATWTPPPPACSYVYRMAFPVLGGGRPGWSVFGEPRDGGGRLHAGVDILAPKLTPVVSVRAGTVIGVHGGQRDCCWVTVRHDDGWISMYVHLNNDTVGTNDGGGVGIRSDLVEGMRVEQGELLGWIGDSGNAEGGPPHLHFELRTPWGEPIDPGPSLYSARRRAHPGMTDDSALAAHYGWAFIDYHDDRAGTIFDTATAIGLPAWCDAWGIRACPDTTATRESVSRWITALGGNPEVPQSYFDMTDPIDDPTPYLSLRAECDTPLLCSQPVTRGEVAVLVVRAGESELLLDEASAMALLHSRGQLDVCDPRGLDPDEQLTRVGALRMLLRAWGYLPTPPCGQMT